MKHTDRNCLKCNTLVCKNIQKNVSIQSQTNKLKVFYSQIEDKKIGMNIGDKITIEGVYEPHASI